MPYNVITPAEVEVVAYTTLQEIFDVINKEVQAHPDAVFGYGHAVVFTKGRYSSFTLASAVKVLREAGWESSKYSLAGQRDDHDWITVKR